jgi:carboxylate-amine ligase
MVTARLSFTVGIEEEYLLVYRRTRDLVAEPPSSMMAECMKRLRGQVVAEFLRSQIEVATGICTNLADAHADLAHLRETVNRAATGHGLAAITASTHPFADWSRQIQTDMQWSNMLARDMQRLARRLLVCGMHVHIGIEDLDLRIIRMQQVRCLLPHLLALSTSSPFWRGEDSGLKCYRLRKADSPAGLAISDETSPRSVAKLLSGIAF